MTGSRREFFSRIPAATALAGTWASFAAAMAAERASANDDEFWSLIRRHFPLEDSLIYLNAANVCPASRPVMDRHLEYLRDFHANPSFQNRDKYGELQERARAKLAKLAGVTADEIALVRNTSEGTNAVVNGIDLKAGDEVIVTDHNHPSNLDSWRVRARRVGFTVRSLPVAVPAPSADALLDAFRKAMSPRTRVVAVTHLTSTTGILYPAREIAALAKQHSAWMHLDGAQTFGALNVNLREIGCDSYSTSMHKWPMGPLEAGMLYVRSDRIAELWPSLVTAGWSNNLKGARKFEVFGQRDNPRIVAVDATADFLNLIGMDRVEARMRVLADRAKRGLQSISGVRVLTNMEPALSGGVVKFQVPNMTPRKAYDALWARHRISTASTESGDSAGIRYSPHIYNSLEDIDRAVAAVKELER